MKAPENMKLLIGDGFLGVDYVLQSEHYSEHCTKLKLPFPFSPRAYYTAQWDCFLSDKRAIIVQEQMSSKSQEKMKKLKGFVETTLQCKRNRLFFVLRQVSGWLLEADEKDEKTTMTWMIHVDSGVNRAKESSLT